MANTFRDGHQFCDIYHIFNFSSNTEPGNNCQAQYFSDNLSIYFISMSFWILVTPPVSAFTKYTPLATAVASQIS